AIAAAAAEAAQIAAVMAEVAASAAAAAATAAGGGYCSENPMSCFWLPCAVGHLCASRGPVSEPLPMSANISLPYYSSASTFSAGGSNFACNLSASAPKNKGNTFLHHRRQGIIPHTTWRPCHVGYSVAAPPADLSYFTACMLGRSPIMVEKAAVATATITESLLLSTARGRSALGSSVCSDGGPTTPNCGGGGFGFKVAAEPCLSPAEGPFPTTESSGIMLSRPSILTKGLAQMLETLTVLGDIERPVVAAAAAAAVVEAATEVAAEAAAEAAETAVAKAAPIPSSSSLSPAVSSTQCRLTTAGPWKSPPPPPSQLREAHKMFLGAAAAACRNFRRLGQKLIPCCLFPDCAARCIAIDDSSNARDDNEAVHGI
ncbi:hypothetical protein Vafri_290, partial [Volvox africanus]